MKKKTAVIILNWNGRKLLEQFLPSAVANTVNADTDLWVADNGSTDGSVEFIRSHYPSVRIMELGENYGFAEGYNRAIAATGYRYTILLNSDVEVTPGWTVPLVELLESRPDVGAVMPKIRSWRQRDMFEYAGAAGGYLDNLGYPYCRGRVFDKIERDEGQYDGDPVEVAWATGAALCVRTGLYLELGGLDREFFAHMEEIDLCCRMIGAGYKVMAEMKSTVYHVGGASLPKSDPKKTYLNFRNNLLLLHKNLPAKRGRKILFLRRLADTLAFIMFLVKGNTGDARAVLRAHRDFRRMRGNYTSLPAEDYMSRLPGAGRSILIDHYLLRKV
ncbi:MAG: glycosyltransferase family 2 protein [Muribaculaceae bacterium]|nr:glycosyltransferase family 2 protein [Muribaculaceae bacterium]